MTHKLTINLIPKTSFHCNLRSKLAKNEWDYLRKMTYISAKYSCEICGGVGPQHPVEAHEEWSYNTDTGIQRLEKIIALCPKCHLVKHIGRAKITNRFDEAIEHLMQINHISRFQANKQINEAFLIWEERNKIQWNLDIQWIIDLLLEAGVRK